MDERLMVKPTSKIEQENNDKKGDDDLKKD